MKTMRIGVDFDGVLAYNPFRVGRSLVAFVKKDIFRIKKLRFFVPRNWFERLIWALLHESSLFPAKGGKLLKDLSKNKTYEFYLVSGRFGYLQPQVRKWLKLWRFTKVFKQTYLNKDEEQPHLFKERIIKELKLDYYIEDNWDIVDYLAKNTSTKIYWIYNIFDHGKGHPHRFAYLEQALKKITS